MRRRFALEVLGFFRRFWCFVVSLGCVSAGAVVLALGMNKDERRKLRS